MLSKGVCPVWCGEKARQNALDYAQQRAGYGRCDIQLLDENWKVVETITNEDLKPVGQAKGRPVSRFRSNTTH
jgi:hypothetical protein